MGYRIIVDSCCDLTQSLMDKLNARIVALTLTLGNRSYTDDDALDLPRFMVDMAACKERVGSAAPAPQVYLDAFGEADTNFVVTLSSNLSASYSSAMVAREMAETEGADVHVFDSKTASAGQVLLALKLRDLIENGLTRARIIAAATAFIGEMKTFFVLDNIDNLLKNGRLNKMMGKIISVLHIKPLMGADENGNIALYGHARGQSQIVEKLAETIEKSGRATETLRMVISHCNNAPLAEKLRALIERRYRFREIVIVPTRGVSSLYANEKGIVIAF